MHVSQSERPDLTSTCTPFTLLTIHLQVIVSRDQRAFTADAPQGCHVTLAATVNAVGASVTPLIIFQGERAMSKLIKGWPEAHLAMDGSGYMTKEIFVGWFVRWEAATRPADPSTPRGLLLDNHYSHLVVEVLELARSCNVRIMGLHAHTTHLLCALDCGIFMSYKQQLRRAIVDLQRQTMQTVTKDSLAGCMKKAWGITTTMTVNTVTEERTSIVITAFKTTGIYPFNRNVVDEKHYATSDAYKAKNDAAQAEEGAAAAAPPKARLTLTPEQLKVEADGLTWAAGGMKPLSAEAKAKVDAVRKTVPANIWTNEALMVLEADKELKKQAAEEEKELRKEGKAAALAARGGLTAAAFKQQESAKAKEAKALAKQQAAAAQEAAAQAQAVPVAAAAAKPAKKAASKRSRTASPPPADVYGRTFKSNQRGAPKPR